MRVLWVCNIMIPAIAERLNLPYSSREGWLSGMADKLLSPKNSGRVELGICFPGDGGMRDFNLNMDFGEGISCKVYAFEEDLGHPETYNPALEDRFQEIFEDFKPELLHIFGTEFPHCLAAVKAFGNPDRTLIGIQGVCSEIAKVYTAGVPWSVKNIPTLRDILKRDGVNRQVEKFLLRGEHEIEAIKGTGHVTGRTAFDKNACARINPNAEYHAMNETMRSCFYRDSWKRDLCESHSIFLSQGDYPLKGFHHLLQAMPKIAERYPDVKLYVAGANILENATWKDRLKRCAYARYLKKLIRRGHLKNRVFMLGKLTDQEMKKQYLNCNVFVLPSVLENSPNSLGEAMLLGVPCVASRTGGVPDILVEGQDGLLFTPGQSRELAAKVCEIFEKEDITGLYSINAKHHAYKTHDADANFAQLLIMYLMISEDARSKEAGQV